MNKFSTLIFATLLALAPVGLAVAQEAAAPIADNPVARAVFTTGIKDREPADTVTTLGTDHDRVYFFTELRGLGGQNVTHRWLYQGKTMAEVRFAVGGPRWRVWSSKTLRPQWTGGWRVEVLDGAGNKIGEGSFTYGAAPAAR